MPIINFTAVDSHTSLLEKDGKALGELKSEGFFRPSVTAVEANNRIFDLSCSGFFRRTYEFRQGNEIFVSLRMLPFGRLLVEDNKRGIKYFLRMKSVFKNKYELTDENGEALLYIRINRGFFATIKKAVIETTYKFDNVKEHFLICCASLLAIKMRLRRKAASVS